MKVIAITSGKGGVGKTNISANLAISLAEFGERVVVLDGDIGLANLDVILGCKADATLQDVITGQKRLLEIVQQGPGNIRYIAGGSGIETLFTLDSAQSERFTSDLMALAETTDILLLDTGAGLDANVLNFLSAANEILIVVTPDPASITDGYATAKAVIRNNADAEISLIVNQVVNQAEAEEVFDHLNGVAKRFLKVGFGFAGYVRYDRVAMQHIRNRIPFVLADKTTPASVDIHKVAAELLGKTAIEPTEGKPTMDFKAKIRSLFQFNRRIA